MILYVDTSALVKLYVEEEHSDTVRSWSDEAEIVATSVVALPEILSALSRKTREGALSGEGLQRLCAQVETDWAALAVIQVRARDAGRLALTHGLRGVDAIHLDAALRVLGRPGMISSAFASFDRNLNRAAEVEGLQVLTPQDR